MNDVSLYSRESQSLRKEIWLKQNIDLRELAFLKKFVTSKTPCSVMMHVQNTIFFRAGSSRSRRSIFLHCEADGKLK